MTIISGHQRLKACKDLNMKLVPVMIREDIIDEDDKLKKLLIANFGRLKNSPVKQGKVYEEYEKLRGVRQGSANKKGSIVGETISLTQDQIAKELGVDVRTIQNLKRLQTLIPDFQELISEGKITATTGYKVLARLSEEEQLKLIKSLDITERFTQREVQVYVDELKDLELKNIGLIQQMDKMRKDMESGETGKEEVVSEAVSEKSKNYEDTKKLVDILKDENEKLSVLDRGELIQKVVVWAT